MFIMEEQGSGKSSEDGEPSTDEDPLETCRKNLEATRKTLQAFDDLDKRWKVRERERENENERDISTCNHKYRKSSKSSQIR